MAGLIRRRLLAIGSVAGLALTLLSARTVFGRESGELPGSRLTGSDAGKQIEETIRRQLNAFRTGDAPSAFAIAAPFIQEKFRSPEIFMEMVRRGYPVIYQPSSVEFLDLTQLPEGGHLQLVQMSDADGKIWMMEYLLFLDEQGNWRINGVQQQKTSSNLI